MAKAIAENPGVPEKGTNPVSAAFASAKDFLRNVRSEVGKLVTPTRAEVQATTTVVIVTVFLFGLFFFLVDWVVNTGVHYLLSTLGGTK